MTTATMTPDNATALRKPFPAESVGKLPKGTCKDCSQSQRKRCDRHQWVTSCPECHGSHSSATLHLDYVGHAATTERLLTVDPTWTWEPFALAPDGLPALDRAGNLWIRLTVCGVTRIGVGDGKSAKECIGDAIRNAAMRFGVALDLWAKEDLTEFRTAVVSRQVEPPAAPPVDTGEVITPEQLRRMGQALTAAGLTTRPDALRAVAEILGRPVESRDDLTTAEAARVIVALERHILAASQQPPEPAAATPSAVDTDADPGQGGGEAPDPGSAEVTLPPSRAMTKPQSRMLFARLNELGVDNNDREERLAILSGVLGREIGTTSALNREDAQRLLDDLAKVKDRPGLNALLDQLDAARAQGGQS